MPTLIRSHWFGSLLNRIFNRPDSEHEQAVIRLIFGLLGTLYVAYLWFSQDGSTSGDTFQAIVVGLIFCIMALGLIVAILLSPASNPPRRTVGIVVDTAVTSYALSLLGVMGTPLFAIYLWIILGNGFRYGLSYLLLTTALSVLGFCLVIITTPFWSGNQTLALGLLFVLGVIPLYAGTMIQKIHKSVRRIEESDREKSRFIAMIADAFRTPLNGVTGMTNVLMQTPLSAGQKEIAETVVTSGRMLNELLNNVSGLHQIESGKLEIANTRFNLHVLINGLMTIFMPLANERGLEFRVNMGPDVPAALIGDPNHLRQILVNLVSNGVKYTNTGFVEMTISLKSRSEENAVLRFEIKDTGPGMNEETKKRLFLLMGQTNDSAQRIYGGAGLGTTVASHLVGLMGGRLEMRSQVGSGSVFWFDLPFTVDARHDKTLGPESGLLSCRCLLVTASEPLRLFVTSLLDRWSAPYTVVENSATALATLKEGVDSGAPYQVVMVDSGSPQAYAKAFSGVVEAESSLFGLSLTVFRPINDLYSTGDYLAAGYSSVMNSPPDTRQLFNMLHAVVSRESEFPELQRAAPLTEIARPPVKPKSTLNILVAEDNPVNQAITRKILISEGHQVTIVSNGKEALEALSDNDFDLVIADLRMPEMGGLEAMRAYHSNPGHRRVPWLVLTADVTNETMRECARSGADGYLTKPVNPTLLLARVSQVTEAARQSDQLQDGKSGTEQVLIDTSRIHTSRDNTSESLGQRIGRFEENAETCLERIRYAIPRNDHTAIRLASITFESYCSDIGAVRLCEILSEFDHLLPVYQDTLNALRSMSNRT
jgi:two-component system sensor histidine kinase RpfC